MHLPPSTVHNSSKGNKLKTTGAKRFFKYGVPFLLLIVGGSFGLREFQLFKFKHFRDANVSAEDMAKYGVNVKPKSEVTLETEFEKISKIDIDNWQNIRGPRAWEE